VPVLEVFEGLCLLLAGALLLTPGFITDAIGALLLLPPVRATLYRELRRRLEHRIVTGTAGGGPGPPPDDRGAPIDVDFEEIEPDDERGPMPPPRGRWDREP